MATKRGPRPAAKKRAAKRVEVESVEFCDVLRWHGKPTYRCQKCPHATTDPREARMHYQKRHSPASPTARNTGLVDRHSRPIAVIETKEG